MMLRLIGLPTTMPPKVSMADQVSPRLRAKREYVIRLWLNVRT